MTTAEGDVRDEVREQVAARVGQPMSGDAPAVAPDEVNLPMIRHWVDALDDRNPIYLDPDVAARSRHGGLVAPPAMLQTWTMGRPRVAGIAERGGAAGELDPDSPIELLKRAGFPGTLATNSELEFDRYLRLGDRLTAQTALESISELKNTGLGAGYFVTWVTTYRDAAAETVGRQRFRILKFRPGASVDGAKGGGSARRTDNGATAETPGEELPPFELDVTATVIVAGAIASRDFMPAHHDRDFARAQGAPDVFMNILTTNGYVSRFVTDWAGPDATLRAISVRLGVPAVPGHPLRFTGRVAATRGAGAECLVDVSVRATNALGDHVTGTVTLQPSEGRGRIS